MNSLVMRGIIDAQLNQAWRAAAKGPNNHSPPYVDRIWGIWGSYYTIPQAIFYLLKEDYKP